MSSHNYVIKPDFDENLQSIKEQLIEARDGLDEEHMRVGRILELDTEKKLHLENQQVYGYCLRVTKAEASTIRGKKGFQELGTQKAGTYFTTPTLKEHSNNYADLLKSYTSTQTSLVKEVVEIAASYIPVLETLDTVIAKLDVLIRSVTLAMTKSGATADFVRPPTASPTSQSTLRRRTSSQK